MDNQYPAEPVVLPKPSEISQREKEDAMGAYLMMFAAWGAGLPFPLLNLIAAIIYFALNKKKSRFVAFHSYQSLLTQVPISFLNAGVLGWGIFLFVSPTYGATLHFFSYLVFVVIWNLLYAIFSIVACIKARKGKFYYFWVFGRLSFARYYGPHAVRDRPVDDENRPPQGF